MAASALDIANWRGSYDNGAVPVTSFASVGNHTPLAGKGYVVNVLWASITITSVPAPTLTGGGLTWVLQGAYREHSTGEKYLATFAAVGAGADGALTFTAGNLQGFRYAKMQASEVSGAVVSSAAAFCVAVQPSALNLNTDTPTIDTSGFTAANCVIAAFARYGGSVSFTPGGAGFTELYDVASTNITGAVTTKGTTDAAASGTFTSGAAAVLGQAVSLAAAPVGPDPDSVAPASGPAAGGTAITITGTGFDASGGASEGVTIGGAAATSVVFVNATTIICVTPEHAVGAVDVVVTNGDGTSGTLVGGFFYDGAIAVVNPGATDGAGDAVPAGELSSTLWAPSGTAKRAKLIPTIGGVVCAPRFVKLLPP